MQVMAVKHGKENIMSTAITSHPHRLNSAVPRMRSLTATILALWLVIAFWLGANGAFLNPRGTPPLALLAAVIVPIFVFLGAYWTSSSFLEFVLAADVHLLTATQAWRFGGLGFI